MKTYNFDPTEFAKLQFLLGHAVAFLLHERSKSELDQFQTKFFPILREVNYQVLAPKIDDSQHLAISASEPDPWDPELPTERAIEILTQIFKA